MTINLSGLTLKQRQLFQQTFYSKITFYKFAPMLNRLILISLVLFSGFAKAQDFTPSSKGEIIHHTYFTLAYNEQHEQAAWVFYKLTRDQVFGTTSRDDDFRPDPAVSTTSAQLTDYKGSGYDRGHLCPAADMKISPEAMSESFYLSNMSPQDPSFNRGIWTQLEEEVRSLALSYNQIYVVTGPIFKDCLGSIGANKVTVPGYYYKVIYIPLEKPLMLGFVLPNCAGNKQHYQYSTPVDSIESLTSIDFFPQLNDNLEASLEASVPSNIASIITETPNRTYTSSTNTQTHSNKQYYSYTTQCLGIAKSTHQRCKSRTTNANGYCNAHQYQVP